MPDTDTIIPCNRLTFLDRAQIFLVLSLTPIILLWTSLKWPFSSYAQAHGLKRFLVDRAMYHILENMSRRQLRALFGPTRNAYSAFMKKNDMPEDVEDVGEGAKLLWVGPRSTERTILYFHGGAFLLGAFASAPGVWWHMKSELAKRGKDTSIAMLQYTLVPDRVFPTQLTQAICAIQRILDSGIEPANIIICGDSAGGLLIHEVLSHILHPMDGVPKLKLSSPLGGAIMLSPWTRLVDPDDSLSMMTAHDLGIDIISSATLKAWGAQVREGVPDSALPYLEANEAPQDWLQGLDKRIKQIMIIAGSVEVLREEIIKYSKAVEQHLASTTTIIHENGVHVDPYLDFIVGVKDGYLTPSMVDFLDKGFSVSS